MHVTPDAVAPMMRGASFQGARRAFFCLWDQEVAREVTTGVRSVLRDWNVHASDAEALVSDILGRAEQHIEDNHGISVPDGFFQRREICRFLRTFGSSRAIDHMRSIKKRETETMLAPVTKGDGTKVGAPRPLPEPVPTPPDVDEALLSAIRRVAEMNLAPARSFALGCLYLPDLVDLDWFTFYAGRISRTPTETLALWEAWWREHPFVTMNRETERLQHLVWILRTRDTGDWRAWVASNRKDCDAYVNTLQAARAFAIDDARNLLVP